MNVDKALYAMTHKLQERKKKEFLEGFDEKQLKKIASVYETHPSSGTKKKLIASILKAKISYQQIWEVVMTL